MGIYKYIRDSWRSKTDESKKLARQRLIQYRREPVTLRLEHPTRLDRARNAGYKAKEGVLIVKQRDIRGSHKRRDRAGGRRSKHSGRKMNLQLNYQAIAERRANSKFINCEVVNSYFLAKDGRYYWYEVILIDRTNPTVLADKQLSGIAKQKGRAQRGITSANRISRGLRWKGKGSEKTR